MSYNPEPGNVILWGAGHTHLQVIRKWPAFPSSNPPRLTCVSDFATTAYSGMLSGVLAGQYPRERMEIDLRRLCESVGARLVVGEVVALDRNARRLSLKDQAPLPFDVLSIGIGSVPARDGVTWVDESVVPIKPMQTFLDRLDAQLRALASRPDSQPIRAAVVGAGAGGIEVAFCLPSHVRRVLGDVALELTLIDAHPQIGVGLRAGTVERVRRVLQSRGVRLLTGKRVDRAGGGRIVLEGGKTVEADLILWVAGAAPPPILATLGLPTDERGFLLTDSTLQTTTDDSIFVVGDCGTVLGSPTPKAGVHAVRQGPILWNNLAEAINDRPGQPYVPQKDFLKLLNTGDGQAIAEYAGFSFQGRWCWWLKDRIDSRFMDRYQNVAPSFTVDAPA
ncbi:MAG: FAD-dependent oxidoreductase [Isosphaeraceae bacterium]